MSRQARKHLDRRFGEPQDLHHLQPPHKGWIRAIRDAIGMSSTELASRMGVSQQAVAQLEKNERNETIKIENLQRAARSLDCELVYAIVPRTSLTEAVQNQARRRAMQHLQSVAHHSQLENQSITDPEFQEQVNELTAKYVDRRGLWTDE